MKLAQHGRAALEIAPGRDAVGRAEVDGVLGAENLFNLFDRPDVEGAFLAFAVRIQAGEQAAFGSRHLPAQEVDGLADWPGEFVRRLGPAPQDLGVDR